MTVQVATADDLQDTLATAFARLGIGWKNYAHPPVFTVAEGEGFKKALPGGHTKNLFLKDKRGALWLVTALSDTAIDLKALAAHLGAGRFSFGSPALLGEVLGVIPGAVTPLALLNDAARRVRPVLDARLVACDIVNVHPLRNDRTTAIRADDLLLFQRDLGYNPLIIDFAALAPI